MQNLSAPFHRFGQKRVYTGVFGLYCADHIYVTAYVFYCFNQWASVYAYLNSLIIWLSNPKVFFFAQMTFHHTSKWSLWQPRCTWRATVWFWPAWQRAVGHWSSNGCTMARNWHASHWSTGELCICHSCHIITKTNRHINLSLPFNKFLICGYLFRCLLISMHLFWNGRGS